jgi:CubicO group peptidase (beta-lactamase class C family)
MTHAPDRRTVALALAGLGLAAAKSSPNQLIAAADGPGTLSAGLISRGPDGRILCQMALGRAWGPKGAFRPFTLEAPFRVASVSKMVATVAILPLFMVKGVDLDSDASDHLGFRLRHPAYPQTPITPRMLLSHTSGLRNGPSYPVPLGHALREAFLPGGRHYDEGQWFGPATYRPGAWFTYADVNFALLAQMAEALSGQRFDLFMHQALFSPLGLDIGFNWSGVSAGRRARAAAGMRWLDGAWTPQVDAPPPPFPELFLAKAKDLPDVSLADYRPGTNGFLTSPLGGLRLGLKDMDRLARVFSAKGRWRGRQVMDPKVIAMMEAPAWRLDLSHPNGQTDEGVFQSYGLGMQTPMGRPGPNGDAFFGPDTADWRGHLGDAYGWMTGLFWNVKDGRTMVWAINGMPETERPPGLKSTLTRPEEVLVDWGLSK